MKILTDIVFFFLKKKSQVMKKFFDNIIKTDLAG